jgi:hypothetical protein
LIQHLDDQEERALSELVDERIAHAPAPGQGIDTDALARIVEAGRATTSTNPRGPGREAQGH